MNYVKHANVLDTPNPLLKYIQLIDFRILALLMFEAKTLTPESIHHSSMQTLNEAAVDSAPSRIGCLLKKKKEKHCIRPALVKRLRAREQNTCFSLSFYLCLALMLRFLS
jgi:hypothetical protein